MRKFKRTSRVILCVSAAALLSGLSSPAIAATGSASTQADEVPAETEIRIGSSYETAEVMGYVGENDQVEPPSADPVITPFLFDAGDVLNCNVLNDEDWVISDYYTYGFSNAGTWLLTEGYVDLRCGTEDTSGFKHIRSLHQYGSEKHPNSWEAFRDSYSDAAGYDSPYTWDDFMHAAISDSLEYPSAAPQQQSNEKVCLSTTFYVWLGTTPYSKWFANTVISQNNRVVVTAYLSDDSSRPDCDGNE